MDVGLITRPEWETTVDSASTLQTVQTWPECEQLDFLFRAWDDFIDRGRQPELTEELQGELLRRVAAYEADPGHVLPWEQIESHVRRPR